MEMNSLEADKTITFFDSDELDLFSNIDEEKSQYKWVNEGEE